MDKMIKSVKAKIDAVNEGHGSYEECREAQKELALFICRNGTERRSGKVVTLTPAAFLVLNKRDFPEGTLIRCGNYRVDCNGSRFECWSAKTLVRIPPSKIPRYIWEFIH